jgi:hypothetical protein
LMRFFQTVHHWDDEIGAMKNRSKHTSKRRLVHYKPAM